jgi:hypothetical protein
MTEVSLVAGSVAMVGVWKDVPEGVVPERRTGDVQVAPRFGEETNSIPAGPT